MMLKLELKESIGGKHAKQTLDCFRHGRHSICWIGSLVCLGSRNYWPDILVFESGPKRLWVMTRNCRSIYPYRERPWVFAPYAWLRNTCELTARYQNMVSAGYVTSPLHISSIRTTRKTVTTFATQENHRARKSPFNFSHHKQEKT